MTTEPFSLEFIRYIQDNLILLVTIFYNAVSVKVLVCGGGMIWPQAELWRGWLVIYK